MLPFYIMDRLSYLHGIPGLFLSSLFAGALRYKLPWVPTRGGARKVLAPHWNLKKKWRHMLPSHEISKNFRLLRRRVEKNDQLLKCGRFCLPLEIFCRRQSTLPLFVAYDSRLQSPLACMLLFDVSTTMDRSTYSLRCNADPMKV